MKTNFTLIFLFIIIFGCNDHIDPMEGVFLDFYPRKANYSWTNYVKRVIVTPDEQEGIILEDIYSNICTVEEFQIMFYTSSIDSLPYGYYSAISGPYKTQYSIDRDLQDLDNNNTVLERKLEDDFLNCYGTKKNSNTQDVIKQLEYRTNGISNLTITCNKTIFGKESGVSLNSFFHIAFLSPQQIISSETNDLIFGCSDELNEMSIENWLNLKPTVQPSMGFCMNSIPKELPGTFSFTIRLETEDGKVIESTGREIQILE